MAQPEARKTMENDAAGVCGAAAHAAGGQDYHRRRAVGPEADLEQQVRNGLSVARPDRAGASPDNSSAVEI